MMKNIQEQQPLDNYKKGRGAQINTRNKFEKTRKQRNMLKALTNGLRVI
jgi:hypothetical protein